MAELSPDRRILEYLNHYGIGNYKRINVMLFDLFPGEESLNDFKNRNIRGDVWSFLNDLSKHELISYRTSHSRFYGYFIEASIQMKGVEYLRANRLSSGTYISGSGHHVNVIAHSPSSRIEERNTNKNITNIIKPSSPRKKFLIVISIIGMIASIVTIQQGWFPNIFKHSTAPQQADSTKKTSYLNPEIEFWTMSKFMSPTDSFQRHFLLLDMAINEFLKPKNFRFKIYCFAADPESFAYAKEFYKKLICDNRSFYKSTKMTETINQLETNHYLERDEYFIIFTSESELEIRIKPRHYPMPTISASDPTTLDFSEKTSELIPDSIVFKNNYAILN